MAIFRGCGSLVTSLVIMILKGRLYLHVHFMLIACIERYEPCRKKMLDATRKQWVPR